MASSANTRFIEGYGDRIRYIRRKARLNQDELGKELNLSRQSINGYENERAVPSFKALNIFCEKFNVNPWWLLYGIGEPAPSGANESARHLSKASTTEPLTHEQLALIEYIRADGDAAKNLARFLWGRAIELVLEE